MDESTLTTTYDDETLQLQADFARTMGHATRLQILHLLNDAGGELACAALLEATGVSKPSLSQHLAKMAAVGLVETRREGRYLFVRIAQPEIGEACRLIHDALSRFAQRKANIFCY